MNRAQLLERAIVRLEYEGEIGHAFGLNDDEYNIVRETLRCTPRQWFRDSLDAHPRIVALGFALAVLKTDGTA